VQKLFVRKRYFVILSILLQIRCKGLENPKKSELNIFKGDPDYEKIKSELDPLKIVFFSLAKRDRKYIQFKQSLDDLNKRFVKTIQTTGTVESIQKLAIPLMEKEKVEGDHRLSTVIGLFRYLGLVESLGAQLVDLLILLLVANGYEFHVEREHEVPRIIHATTLKDLRNAFLGPKVRFLKRCKLKRTAKIIDVDLRNSIAHLDFEINEKGQISAKSQGKRKKEINIYQKINEFIRKWTMINFMLNEIQEHAFGATGKRLIFRKRRQ